MTRIDALRTVVVEDERLARTELTALLRQFSCIDLVGEAADLASARTLLQQAKPQLLFLDVQLGDGSGFELLDGMAMFDGHVVFVTAYEAFALRAFEVNALDYLLKPVQHDRLKAAIDRARAAATPAEHGALGYDDYVFLRLGEGSVFVAVASILAITAEGDYTVVHTEGHAHLVLKPVKQWEARLPGNAFVRIHRSTIVNLRKVGRLESWFNHGYRVFVDGLAKPLTMSRRYRHRLSDRFG